MTQQRFWREHDAWLTERPGYLPPEQVEEVCGSCRIRHDHIILRRLLQKSFGPATGVLRSLTLIAMRQKHNQSVHSLPFRFCAGDELINNHLCSIYKVTKLRFP